MQIRYMFIRVTVKACYPFRDQRISPRTPTVSVCGNGLWNPGFWVLVWFSEIFGNDDGKGQ